MPVLSDENTPSPLVSVLIPVYNADDGLLARTLGAIFGQTLQSFEIVLVDDGSSNGCVKRIPPKYLNDARLRVIRQDNTGVQGAVNTGLKHIRGTFFYSMAQDDFVHPQTLEYCMYVLKKEDADFCIFNAFEYGQGGIPECSLFKDFDAPSYKVLSYACRESNPVEYANAFYKLNMDGWGHFARTSLVKEIHAMWPMYDCQTRPHLMMIHSRRWVSSTIQLYYYNSENPDSISKKSLTSSFVSRAQDDFEALCMLYDQDRRSAKTFAIWESVLDNFIIKGVKMVVNGFRRLNKNCAEDMNVACLRAISGMLWRLRRRGALPMTRINFRLYLIFRWIMFRYKPSDDIAEAKKSYNGIDFGKYLTDPCCINKPTKGESK